MDTRVEITVNELLDALSVTSDAPENAKTVRELRKETGWNADAIRDGLQKLADEGRLLVYRVHRTAIDGRRAAVSAYAVMAK